MTPTAVGLVLVEGHGADGEIMDQDAFDVPTRRGATAISTSEYVAGAMSRTRAMAHGRRPHAIGVTWSDESELEASLLLTSLTDAGFDNIVAVRCPEAGEALARGIGRAVGYRQTALCLLEPESVVVSMVDTDDEAVHSVTYDQDATNRGLIGWLSGVFDVNDRHPECLIIVGPDAGLTALAKQLEQALGIPVFAPPEAELALARGAALASAQVPEFTVGEYGLSGHQARGQSRSLPYTAALTMLVVGVLAFVVSVSLVAGLKLTSSYGSATAQAQAQAQRQAAKPPAPPVAARVVPPPAAPPPLPAAPPPPAAPVLPPAPTAIPTLDAPIGPTEEVSAGEPEQAPAPDAAPPPASDPPPAAVPPPPAAPPVPGAKPPLLTRILSHIPGLHQDVQPPANTSPGPDTGPPADAPPPPPPG